MLKTALKLRWIAALVLALAISGVFVLLSQWQFSRSLETDVTPPAVTESVKPLTATLKPGVPLPSTAADQLVTATGHFDASKQVIVQSRLQDKVLGYWVVTAFVVDGAPVLTGQGASAQMVIPVARGWIADPAQASAPPSGPLELGGRLIPAEAPISKPDVPAGQVSALSTAELVNLWQTSSYPAFIVANSVIAHGTDVGAGTGELKKITVTAQPDGTQINWLNIFYSIEWVVFAGFAVFLWWRLVGDDYRRQQEAEQDALASEESASDGDEPHPETTGASAAKESNEAS